MSGLRPLVTLCAIGLVCFLSYNLIRMPVLSLFAQVLGAGPEGIGLVVAVSTLTGVALKLPSGVLSDLYGRRAVLLIGVLAFGLPPFVYPFVSDLDVLVGLRAVHGLATALFAPVALAAVADLYRTAVPEAEAGLGRGAAIGWYIAATQAGALLGPVLGGWLIDHGGFPAAFLTAGLFGCLGVALLLALPLPASAAIPAVPPRRAMQDLWRGVRRVAGQGAVVVTSVTDAAQKMANGALMAFLPLYGLMSGLAAIEVGLLFGVQGMTSFLSKPIMGRLSDQVGRRPLILAGLLLCAGSFALIPQATTLAPLVALTAGFGLGEAIVSSSSSALVADLAKSRTLGAAMGLQGTIMDIGHASGPLVSGVLIGQLGYGAAFAVIAGLQVAAAAGFRVMTRRVAP